MKRVYVYVTGAGASARPVHGVISDVASRSSLEAETWRLAVVLHA